MDKVLAGHCDEDDKLLGRIYLGRINLGRTSLFSPGVITTAGWAKEFPLVAQYQNLQLHRDGSN